MKFENKIKNIFRLFFISSSNVNQQLNIVSKCALVVQT